VARNPGQQIGLHNLSYPGRPLVFELTHTDRAYNPLHCAVLLPKSFRTMRPTALMFCACTQGVRVLNSMASNSLHFLWHQSLYRTGSFSVPDITMTLSNPKDVFDKAVGTIIEGDPIGLEALLRCAEVRTCRLSRSQFTSHTKLSVA
jgi:hypothetical protein